MKASRFVMCVKSSGLSLKVRLFALGIVLAGSTSAMSLSSEAPDLVALAKSGNHPTFAQVLDARFGPSGDTRFKAYENWSRKITPEERARWYRQSGTMPDGKPRFEEITPCSYPDSRSLNLAMAAAATKVRDRGQAEKAWQEVERTYGSATTLEQAKLAEARVEAAKRPTVVGKELAVRVAIDQAWREAGFAREHDSATDEAIGARFSSRLCHIDNDNTTWLKAVVAKGQWPLTTRDGKDAAHEAWLLAQHADNDTDFQNQVLRLMEPLVTKHEASGKDYAYLFDRVALAQGRPQRYATQFTQGKGGCLVARRTEDPAGIGARRAAAGIPPIEEYAKVLTENYHVPACNDLFGEPA